MSGRRLPTTAIHFVDAVNWPSVQQNGLSPAAAFLATDVAARPGVRDHRPDGLTVGGVFVRDQAPMPPSSLRACLDMPLVPGDWYAMVNAGVYFWLDPERARRHARALRGRPQIRLSFDTRSLIAAYAESILLTPFNVGAARRRPTRRGERSFVPLEAWRATGWASEATPDARARPNRHPPAELVIRQALPDILQFVTRIDDIPADMDGERL